MQPVTLAFWSVFALWWLILAVFYLFPGLDIAASRHFFVETVCGTSESAGTICGSFPISENQALEVLRSFYFYLPVLFGLWVIYQLILAWSHHGASYDKKRTNRLLAGLVSLIIGPGLMVNEFLKSTSHRPRPRNTDFFGGDLVFFPAGDFGGACGSNCSFVSGEAAGAGWLFCFALFLIPKKYRPLFMPLLIAISLTMPVMRLAYGGHYLSDILLGWLSSVVVFLGILTLFTKTETKPAPPM